MYSKQAFFRKICSLNFNLNWINKGNNINVIKVLLSYIIRIFIIYYPYSENYVQQVEITIEIFHGYRRQFFFKVITHVSY